MILCSRARLGLLFILILWGGILSAQESPSDTDIFDSVPLPGPPSNVEASDFEYDNGGAIEIRWDKSPDDPRNMIGYNVYRAPVGGEYEPIVFLLVGPEEYLYVDEKAEAGKTYTYRVAALNDAGETMSEPSNPAQGDWEFFDFAKLNILVLGIIVGGSVVGFIFTARAGKKLFIRKIAGLESLEEAVGRATEMGRPILFIPGILDMDDVQTLAAITILSRVSRIVADYDSKIEMPVSRSLVMTTARETIKNSYLSAGRPDAYSDDMVHYVTDEQFGYVAAVNGIMVREKPATCLYLGAFFAESLILAETGNSIGAIQIAGTARPGQLPFFVAACDYTLIGEELFAASAYLSGDPKQLGSLKGQDVGKFVAMAAMIVGTIAITLATAWQWESMQWLTDLMMRMFSTN